MTHPSKILTTAILSLTLASTAQAYATEPDVSVDDQPTFALMDMSFGAPAPQQGSVCQLQITPELAAALAVNLTENGEDDAVTVASCEAD